VIRIAPFIGRGLLAIALIAGSCGDVLPGSAVPMASCDADEEAGDASGLGQASLELISELDRTLLIPLQSHLLRNWSPQVSSSVVIRRIPHVPKPSFPS